MTAAVRSRATSTTTPGPGLDRALPRHRDDVLLGQAADDERHAGQREQAEEEGHPQQRRGQGAAAQRLRRGAADGERRPSRWRGRAGP